MPRSLRLTPGRLLGWLLVAALLLFVDRARRHQPVHQAEWLSAGDVHLRTLRTGSGDTTLLLLHGYGESLLSWRGLVDRLSGRFRIVAPDLPGFGLSEKPAGHYDLPGMVGRMTDFLDRWTTGPVVVVGHSMGGELAAALAMARPDRIVAAVLIAPAGAGLGMGLTDGPTGPTDERMARWSLAAKRLLVPDDDPSWLAPPDGVTMEHSDSARDRASAAVFREFDWTALRTRFHDLKQPTLLIWGGVDPLIPIGIGRSILAGLPCGRMIEIANSWHRPHVEHPERVAREITQFLADGSMEAGCAPPKSSP